MNSVSVVTQANADLRLEIRRIFDVPRDVLYRLWTEPKHVLAWLGPQGFTGTHFESEAKPGGSWRACMRNDETGEEMWHGGLIREMTPPERLVYTFAWDGDDGKPEHETLITVQFVDLGKKSELIFEQGDFASVESRDNHRSGWTMAFESLADYSKNEVDI